MIYVVLFRGVDAGGALARRCRTLRCRVEYQKYNLEWATKPALVEHKNLRANQQPYVSAGVDKAKSVLVLVKLS